MIQQFDIPVRLPGLNDVIGANRQNCYAGAKLKRETDALLGLYIKAAHLKPVKQLCIVHMVFTEPNRRRDVDNVESAKKFILDALVRSGVLENDNPKHVIACPAYTVYGEGAGVRVTIIDSPDEGYLRGKLRTAMETITEEGG